jgi:hypothetical protein
MKDKFKTDRYFSKTSKKNKLKKRLKKDTTSGQFYMTLQNMQFNLDA